MPKLLIDVGNTRFKWCLDNLEEVFQFPYNIETLESQLTQIFSNIDTPIEVLLASVAHPSVNDIIISWCKKYWSTSLYEVKSTDTFPNLVNGYRKPKQLGVDRILSMVAARRCCQKSFCLVDSGTATTIDYVDENGQHLGGFILPGLDMMRESLFEHTSIPQDSELSNNDVLGQDTPSCVAMGSRLSVIALAERNFQAEKSELFLTGGNSAILAPLFTCQPKEMKHMVLHGLSTLTTNEQR